MREFASFRQWAVIDGLYFRPVGPTARGLPSGAFFIRSDDRGILFELINVMTDELITLPDSANERVIASMQTFWSREERYREHGMLFKRGLLLWGPPGSGKTATVQLLCRQLLAMGGMVVMARHPGLASMGLALLRRIEPARPLICILEDIDEIVAQFGEHELLSLLDGENQVSNVVMIATTNFPERLGARIINRPSRFDERIYVGMPSLSARATYLAKVAPGLNEDERSRWTADTEGLSIAHIRELVAAVMCLDQPYDTVLTRLHSMKVQLKGEGENLIRPHAGFTGMVGTQAAPAAGGSYTGPVTRRN